MSRYSHTWGLDNQGTTVLCPAAFVDCVAVHHRDFSACPVLHRLFESMYQQRTWAWSSHHWCACLPVFLCVYSSAVGRMWIYWNWPQAVWCLLKVRILILSFTCFVSAILVVEFSLWSGKKDQQYSKVFWRHHTASLAKLFAWPAGCVSVSWCWAMGRSSPGKQERQASS